MTQEQAIKAWPMVRAFAEGKQIEFLDGELGWTLTCHPDFDRIEYLRLSNEKAEQERFQRLQSLACAAKELCEWTRHNEYPEKMTSEFMRLTELIDQLDTEVRRVFPNGCMSHGGHP